jgi:hypothetical protein
MLPALGEHKPDASRPFHVLVTSGMSATPMTTRAGADVAKFAELIVLLPESWPVGESDERFYWPIRWLKMLARLPYDFSTWLGMGHTVPNGDPPRPFAPGTERCAMLVLKSISLPIEAQSMTLADGSVLEFFALYPLHRAELELKLAAGTHALIDRFEEAGVDDVVNPARPSVVQPPPGSKRKKWFGLF